MSSKKRHHTPKYDDEKRVRRVSSEGKTKLDKYKHLLYNEDLYDDEMFDDLNYHTQKIQRKSTYTT